MRMVCGGWPNRLISDHVGVGSYAPLAQAGYLRGPAGFGVSAQQFKAIANPAHDIGGAGRIALVDV